MCGDNVAFCQITLTTCYTNKTKILDNDIMLCFRICLLIASPMGVVAKYCDEYVCLCVCLSVCEDISRTTRAIFTKFFVRVAYVCGSVLRHVDDRPHRMSPGRGFLSH